MNRTATWIATAALALSPIAAVTVAAASAAPASVMAKPKTKAYKVTAKINKSVAVAKTTTLKVKGRVTPKAVGEKVTLEQRIGDSKKWQKTGTAKVKGNGKFVLKDKPTVGGVRQYRVVKGASSGLGKGVSKPMEVEVYSWTKLTWRTPGPAVNLKVTSASIATDLFYSSLVTDVPETPSSIEFTLGRKCTRLSASYAMTDTAVSGSTGTASVSTDGSVRATHALTVGSIVEDEVINVENVFRVKFDLTTSAGGVAAVADPEVLCLP